MFYLFQYSGDSSCRSIANRGLHYLQLPIQSGRLGWLVQKSNNVSCMPSYAPALIDLIFVAMRMIELLSSCKFGKAGMLLDSGAFLFILLKSSIINFSIVFPVCVAPS